MSEFKAMEGVDKALSAIEDAATRDRVLRWAVDKFGSTELATATTNTEQPAKKRKGKTHASEPKKKSKSSGGAAKVSIDKDLNLRPKGKQSFSDFAKAKSPQNNDSRNLVCVYYLTRILETQGNTNRVYTCYKDAGWRVPPDLSNSLQITASKKGWLDTSDMSNTRVTTAGENRIEHDMPEKKKGK